MLKDFKTFLLKENVLALALAVVVGGALAKLVSALVEDLLMPVVGAAMPGGAWRDAVLAVGPVRLALGHLAGAAVDFVIVGFAVWRLGRLFERPAPAPAARATRDCPHCDMAVSLRATRCGHCTSDIDARVYALVVHG